MDLVLPNLFIVHREKVFLDFDFDTVLGFTNKGQGEEGI